MTLQKGNRQVSKKQGGKEKKKKNSRAVVARLRKGTEFTTEKVHSHTNYCWRKSARGNESALDFSRSGAGRKGHEGRTGKLWTREEMVRDQGTLKGEVGKEGVLLASCKWAEKTGKPKR